MIQIIEDLDNRGCTVLRLTAFTSGSTPQVASSAAHMYDCSSKLGDVV